MLVDMAYVCLYVWRCIRTLYQLSFCGSILMRFCSINMLLFF